MAVKHVVFALGFLIVGLVYFEHSVSEIKKAVAVSRNGSPEKDQSH